MELELEKKKRMKRTSSNNTDLLLPWLTRALDEELYEGLRWFDRSRRIFYVNWTHKSAEQWTQTEIEVCEGWATHKGKKTGKNEKQLKATFRCALNSKRELREIQRTKRRRYWQFIEPSEYEEIKKTKKSPIKKEKLFVTNLDSCGTSTDDTWDPAAVNPSASLIVNIKQEVDLLRLPPFESFGQFFPLTPPHQSEDIFFFDTDFSESCSPHSEDSRLSSPVETPSPTYQYPAIHNRLQPPNADIWQPNFMSIPQGLQDLANFAQFSNNLDELIRPMCQDISSTNIPTRVTEMDQFVPAIDTFQNFSAPINQYNYPVKSENCITECNGGTNLDDDYLLDFDVDPVACEKLIKELNRLTPT